MNSTFKQKVEELYQYAVDNHETIVMGILSYDESFATPMFVGVTSDVNKITNILQEQKDLNMEVKITELEEANKILLEKQ